MGAPKGHPPYPGCETGGRPKKWTEEKLDELADKLLEKIEDCRAESKTFWWKEWALEIDVLPCEFSQFARDSKKFSKAYEKAKALQEWQVTKGWMYKKFNTNFCQLYLQRNHPEEWGQQQNISLDSLATLAQMIQSGKLSQPDNVSNV